MNQKNMTKEQLLKELNILQKRTANMEESKSRIIEIEEDLRKSELKYRELANLLPQTIFEIDTEGNITFTNKSGLETFGYTLEDLYHGLNAFQMFIPEERDRLNNDIQTVLKEGYLGNKEYTVLRKDGSTFPAIIFASSILHNNKPEGIRGIVIDITERKKAEEDLRKSEKKYRLVVNNAKEIIVVAQDGFVKFANQKTMEFTGYSDKELKSKPFIEFIHPDDRAMVYDNYLKRLNEEDVPETYSFRTIDHKGEVKWLQISAIHTTWENKPATLNFLIDITEQKKAEKDLLEREKQLNQAQKMEAIGKLTGGVAHDFNNILTVIIGFSDYLLMHYKNDKHLILYINNIKEAGNRAASLTHQLLAFSRKQILQPKVVNLNTIISNIKKMVGRLIGEDIELIIYLDPSLENAKLDIHQIEQVIMNLAVNARDAMPKGGKLTIETKNVFLNEEYTKNHIPTKPGPYVMLTISDNGIGMDTETQDHIFEPFYTTKEGKGIGLGLATVYGIVKQSDGYIWVYSGPSKGTTFKIYFPRDKTKVEAIEKEEVSPKNVSGTETVLIVEDDDFVRSMIFTVLTSYGYTVLAAKNGEEALHLINKNPNQTIDLMVTDVVMPGLSGSDLAYILENKIPHMKTLYMSGYTDNTIVHHGILNNGIPFLQKPFNVNDVGKKVREILDN